jgi:hypothetical protein
VDYVALNGRMVGAQVVGATLTGMSQILAALSPSMP